MPKLPGRKQHALHIRKSPWAPLPLCASTEPWAVIYLDPRYGLREHKTWRYCAKCRKLFKLGQKKRLRGDKALYWPTHPVNQSEQSPYTEQHKNGFFRQNHAVNVTCARCPQKAFMGPYDLHKRPLCALHRRLEGLSP